MRRVRRCGRVHVDVKPLRCFGSRRITVPVMAVVGALRSNILAPRRLCELPDFSEPDSALRRAWRMLRKHASRRGRAGIVDRPVDDFALSRALTNVFGGNHIAVVWRRNAGTVDSGAKSRRSNAVHPGENVSLLLRKHASALR